MKSKKKEAKFFCESCGSEVPRNSRTCPECGKFFASVRCPKCGKTGTNDDFIKGCPSCGYALVPDDGINRRGYAINLAGNSGNSAYGKRKSAIDLSLFTNRNKKTYTDSSLPFWIYLVSFAVLVVLIFMLYSCL